MAGSFQVQDVRLAVYSVGQISSKQTDKSSDRAISLTILPILLIGRTLSPVRTPWCFLYQGLRNVAKFHIRKRWFGNISPGADPWQEIVCYPFKKHLQPFWWKKPQKNVQLSKLLGIFYRHLNVECSWLLRFGVIFLFIRAISIYLFLRSFSRIEIIKLFHIKHYL